MGRVGCQFGAFGPHGREVFPDRGEELFFEVAVTGAAGTKISGHGGGFVRGGEKFVELVDRVGLGIFGSLDRS